MSTQAWSFCLQWSRVGIGALVFLIAARHLTLAEIGAFATAYAPIRLTQGAHKAGIAETVILMGNRPKRLDTLFSLSLSAGLILSALLLATGIVIANPVLQTLALIPTLNALGAVPDGLLRKSLRLRNLALRTVTAQAMAAGLALWCLLLGWGVWCLVAFAVTNTVLTNVISLVLVTWRPTAWINSGSKALILHRVSHITARDLLSSAQFPLAQIAIAISFGLPAAGAFQIATRVLSLIEALTISPLRYIALPQFKALAFSTHKQALNDIFGAVVPLSAWIWAGTFAAAETILTLAVGPDHAEAATPLLRALTLFGLCTSLTMPLTQALSARGRTQLVLIRAAIMVATCSTLAVPMLAVSPTATAIALSTGAVLTSLWYIKTALPYLDVTLSDLKQHARSLIAAATMAPALLLLQNVIPDHAISSMIVQIALGTALFVGLLALSSMRRVR